MATNQLPYVTEALMYSRQCQFQVINGSAIRNTSAHDPTTGDAAFFLAPLAMWNGRKLLHVNNGLGVNVSLTMVASYDGTNIVAIGSAVTGIGAGESWYNLSSFAGFADPYPYVGFSATAASSPSSGNLTATLIANSF